MTAARGLVVTGFGTNCEVESAHALTHVGASADVVYFSDLVAGKASLDGYNFLVFPGGFLDGDDLGAAQAAALRWRYAKTQSGDPLFTQLERLLDRGGLVLGICNGFQMLVKLGLLPGDGTSRFERRVSLAVNEKARFEDRWVDLVVNPNSPCVFTKGLDALSLPVRHGEGRLAALNDGVMTSLLENNLVTLQYVDETGKPTQTYPHNPNGSPHAIAGLTNPTGRILGLMPHPEAYNHYTNHPQWTRGVKHTLGLALFAAGAAWLKQTA